MRARLVRHERSHRSKATPARPIARAAECRRRRTGRPTRLAAPPNGKQRIGICCSGGRIRSASYALGALQALQEVGVLERAEYLATVSGGGYKHAPWDVRAYKLRFPNFPNDATAQQLYGEEKFESYRALGHQSMSSAHAALAPPKKSGMLKKAAQSLLGAHDDADVDPLTSGVRDIRIPGAEVHSRD